MHIEIFISEDCFIISDYYSEFYLSCQVGKFVPLMDKYDLFIFQEESILHYVELVDIEFHL